MDQDLEKGGRRLPLQGSTMVGLTGKGILSVRMVSVGMAPVVSG